MGCTWSVSESQTRLRAQRKEIICVLCPTVWGAFSEMSLIDQNNREEGHPQHGGGRGGGTDPGDPRGMGISSHLWGGGLRKSGTAT